MTSTTARMERAGLLTSGPDPADARGKLLAITDRGCDARARGVAAAEVLLVRLAAALDPADIRRTLPFLRALRVALDALKAGSP